MSAIELALYSGDIAPVQPPRYISPAERVMTDPRARKTYDDFMWTYVGSPNIEQRRLGRERPFVPIETDDGEVAWNIDQEMFTGNSALGELVHIRVDPGYNDMPEGYVVAIADIVTGESSIFDILRVEEFRDAQLGPQTILYLDVPGCDELPLEYQPCIEVSLYTQRYTYIPGPHRASSLLRPIEDLHRAITAGITNRPLARTALTLVQGQV